MNPHDGDSTAELQNPATLPKSVTTTTPDGRATRDGRRSDQRTDRPDNDDDDAGDDDDVGDRGGGGGDGCKARTLDLLRTSLADKHPPPKCKARAAYPPPALSLPSSPRTCPPRRREHRGGWRQRGRSAVHSIHGRRWPAARLQSSAVLHLIGSRGPLLLALIQETKSARRASHAALFCAQRCQPSCSPLQLWKSCRTWSGLLCQPLAGCRGPPPWLCMACAIAHQSSLRHSIGSQLGLAPARRRVPPPTPRGTCCKVQKCRLPEVCAHPVDLAIDSTPPCEPLFAVGPGESQTLAQPPGLLRSDPLACPFVQRPKRAAVKEAGSEASVECSKLDVWMDARLAQDRTMFPPHAVAAGLSVILHAPCRSDVVEGDAEDTQLLDLFARDAAREEELRDLEVRPLASQDLALAQPELVHRQGRVELAHASTKTVGAAAEHEHVVSPPDHVVVAVPWRPVQALLLPPTLQHAFTAVRHHDGPQLRSGGTSLAGSLTHDRCA